jgi:hypothetical protein
VPVAKPRRRAPKPFLFKALGLADHPTPSTEEIALRKLSGKLTYANVVSTLCLFLLLGGGAAVAASSLGKNTVGSKQLKKNAVTEAKLKNGAVTSAKIKDGAVTGAKLPDGSVTNAKLGDGSVTTAKIADGAVNGGKVADGSLTGGDINQSTLTQVRASNVYALAFKGDASCTPALPLPAGFSSERQSEGFCKVNFPFSATNCVTTADFAVRGVADNFITVPGDRSIEILQYASQPNTVIVETEFKEARTNSAFDMVSVC